MEERILFLLPSSKNLALRSYAIKLSRLLALMRYKIRRFSFVFFYERRYFPKPRIQVYIRFFRKIFEHKMQFLFRELISPYSSVGRASRCRFRDLREKNSVFPSCGEMHEKRDGRVVCSNQTEGIYFFLFFPPRSNVVKGIHQNRRTLDAFLDLKPRDSF